MDKDIIIVFHFETGDASVPYWTEDVMIKGSAVNVNELEDSIMSYCNNADYNDSEYVELLSDVLNASGLEWLPLSWNHYGKIPECDDIVTLFV